MKVFNPILTGFHPDPSILAANGEYFIANSTFEWYPGVEIHRSKDLVHWTSVPSPLSEERLLNMAGNMQSCGIWAPCLSYSEGMFWLIYTNVQSWNRGPWKDTPNFLTTAKSIEGPWSDPVFLTASGFDPSMFHDSDGKHWLMSMEWDYRKAGYNNISGAPQFSGLLVQEYSPARKRLIGKVHKVWKGTDIGSVEGAHLYKKNGYYYIAAAEGGTVYEHAISCARSKNLFGPYETHPQNPLISSYSHPELTIQKAGHGSWCESPDGKTYLVYLCGRPLPNEAYCPLGRETSFAEIKWQDDWPYVVQPDGSFRNTPPDYVEVPDVPLYEGEKDRNVVGKRADEYCRVTKYDFNTNDYLADFKTLRLPLYGKKVKRFSTTARKGFLRITGGQSPISNFEQGIVARRQTDFIFEAETKMDFTPDYFQQLAGLTYRYDEDSQYNLCLTYDEELGKVLQFQSYMLGEYSEGQKIKLNDSGSVWLKVNANYEKAYFSYSEDGKLWRRIRPDLEVKKLSDEYGGLGFTGAFVGMFCVDMAEHSHYADFEYFTYTKEK